MTPERVLDRIRQMMPDFEHSMTDDQRERFARRRAELVDAGELPEAARLLAAGEVWADATRWKGWQG